MSIDAKILDELKEALLKEQARIEDDLSRIAKRSDGGEYTTTFNNIGTDEDENATEVEEYTDNLAVEDNLQKQLKETREALQRIEDGTYGKCENCGSEIPLERLRVYPAARKCLSC